jgi:hypothetical protein
VVHAVEADLDELEVVPLGLLHEVADDLEVLAAHRVDLVAEPGLVVGPEPLDVDGELADELLDLGADSRRMRVHILGRVGREEAADGDAVDLARGKRGDADDDRLLPLAGDLVPDGQLADGAGVDDPEALVGVVDAVAEPVDPQRAGILAGGHAHPGRDGDRRDDALQAAVAAGVHQAAEVLQPLVAEEQLGGGAVETDDQDLHGSRELPSMAGPLGTPSAARMVGARSTSRAPSPRNGRSISSTPGTKGRVDDVVAAPLPDVVLEQPGGHAPQRRAPGDAVARGEVDEQVGRLGGEWPE